MWRAGDIQFCVYTEPPSSEPLLNLVLGKDGPLVVPDKELESILEGEEKQKLIELREVDRQKSCTTHMQLPMLTRRVTLQISFLFEGIRLDRPKSPLVVFCESWKGEERPQLHRGEWAFGIGKRNC